MQIDMDGKSLRKIRGEGFFELARNGKTWTVSVQDGDQGELIVVRITGKVEIIERKEGDPTLPKTSTHVFHC